MHEIRIAIILITDSYPCILSLSILILLIIRKSEVIRIEGNIWGRIFV